MPNDVKAVVSALTLIVAGDARLLERLADPSGLLDLRHGHRRLHGGGDVDLPRGRRQEGRHEEVPSPRQMPLQITGPPCLHTSAVLHGRSPIDRAVERRAARAVRRAGAGARRRPLPHRSRGDRRLAALSDADRARPRGGRRRRGGRLGGRDGPQGRPRRPVVESALRPLLLLRPRPADPVRGLSRARGRRRSQFDGHSKARSDDGGASSSI